MSRVVERIVGREVEIASIERFLSDVRTGPNALIIRGSAGIGKSTLLEAVVASAEERSLPVLRCGPVQHESRLSFAGLRDLLDDVYDETAAELPSPQRHALAVALLREEPDAPLDRGAVSTAFRTFLRERSRTGPMLVVVDDVQWLDRPTAAALAFAARRLGEEPIGIVLAQRVEGDDQIPLGLDRAFAPEQIHTITLGPLSLGALHVVLRDRLGRSLPRPLLRRVHDASGGNPFFALEIADALGTDSLRPGAALPVPRDLEALLRSRLDSLPADAGVALLVVAASSQPTPELVAAATGPDVDVSDALAAAERAGVIQTRSGQLRFTHPLLASAVYAGAAPDARRSAHRALAEHASDPEERARHLALSAAGPDPSVADALDEAARLAGSRGAPDPAAELADLAVELTPPTDTESLVRRGVEAASYHFNAGNVVRARELFLRAAAATPPGPARAQIMFRLADATWMEVDLVRSYLDEALHDASGEPAVECGIRSGLAWTWIYGGDLDEAATQAGGSLAIAERLEDPTPVSEALATLGICEFMAGRDGEDRIARAVSLRETGSSSDTYTTPHVVMGLRSLWAGELDEARTTLEAVLDHLAERGLYTLATEPYEYLSEIESRAGRYELAARHAAIAIETKLGAGFDELNALDLFPQALVDALRGRVESASRLAREGMTWSERGDRLYANCNRAVLGFLELSRGRFAEADEHLLPVTRFLREMGVREPCVIPVHADAIEALIGMGDLEAADDLLAEFDDQARATTRPWALATAARCRGLVHASRGDAAGALTELEHALEEHRRVPQPLEFGRTLLAKGQVERRTKQRSAARRTAAAGAAHLR